MVARESPPEVLSAHVVEWGGFSRATLDNDGTARSAGVRKELSKLRPAFVRGQINTSSYIGIEELNRRLYEEV